MKQSLRDVISGTRRGIFADALRGALKAASLFYGTGVRIRNGAYDIGLLPTRRVDVPVVSIGNLTAGGTGKTPMVALVADWFSSHGVRPAILSRGYRAHAGTTNDEKLVLDQLCPSVPHLQGADRLKSAGAAIETHHAEVLILDDGFQHRRISRDLDLVLIDALDPWGQGRLLPRGLLREPRTSLCRADAVLLTRADQCSPADKSRLIAEICRAGNSQGPIEVAFRPAAFVNFAGDRRAADSLMVVAAFCGIGNPEGFRRTLTTAGLANVVGFRTFPDHFHYRDADLADLADWARDCRADALVTTQKDLVKIPRCHLGDVPLWSLPIRAEIVVGADRFEALLERVASARTQSTRNGPPVVDFG